MKTTWFHHHDVAQVRLPFCPTTLHRHWCLAILCFIVVLLLLVNGCTPAPESGYGFTLPKGDAEAGKLVYLDMHCNACHSIAGIEQAAASGDQPEVSVSLGGEVVRIETYGELVTSIINPSHRLPARYPRDTVAVDGTSKMENYNDVMTVQQLIDVVAFLQSNYELKPYEPTHYPVYGP
ncbi:MAG: c-type cytochrome [Planctomycetales bacterium]|nr:c-type cytochrome [Planctomycetales bacterium]